MDNVASSNKPIDTKNHIGALMKAIKSADICVFFQRTDLTYIWAENLPKFLQSKWRNCAVETDLFDSKIAEQLENSKLQVLANGTCQNIEVCFNYHGSSIWYNFSIDCHKDQQGNVIGLVTTAVNISQIKSREQVLKLLLREVCHRSKNLLAIIQGIANQTAKFSDSTAVFLSKFQGRLRSLSGSQDLVTHSNWAGASLKELTQAQMSPIQDDKNNSFTFTGANPYLFPNAAIHVGLALHELLTNSISFGALSQNSGIVNIACNIEFDDEQDAKAIVIEWYEECPTAARNHAKSERPSFGSTVLEKIVPSAVSGRASLDIDKDYVRYKLYLPKSQFDLPLTDD